MFKILEFTEKKHAVDKVSDFNFTTVTAFSRNTYERLFLFRDHSFRK